MCSFRQLFEVVSCKRFVNLFLPMFICFKEFVYAHDPYTLYIVFCYLLASLLIKNFYPTLSVHLQFMFSIIHSYNMSRQGAYRIL